MDKSAELFLAQQCATYALDMTLYLTNFKVMKLMNVAEAKSHFSSVLEDVMAGETVLLCKRNVPVAKIAGIKAETPKRHTTDVGWAADSGIEIFGDLTEPTLPESDWDMLS